MLNSANIMRYMKQLGYDVTENDIKKLLKKEDREKILYKNVYNKLFLEV